MRSLANSLATLAFFALLAGCSSDEATGNDYARWSLTGYVVDGATDQPLAGAEITYRDGDGAVLTAAADERGAFVVSELPYGYQTFRFSAQRVSGNDTVRYGSRLLSAGSTGESAVMEGVLANGTRIVRLYPLTGSFRGELAYRSPGSTTVLPARGIQVRLRYRDTSFINPRPEAFAATTDSLGRFQFRALPADTGFILALGQFEIGGAPYSGDPVAVPRLLAGSEVLLPRIVLDQDSQPELREPILLSNVLSADREGLPGVSVAASPWYRLDRKPDPSRLDVTVKAGATILAVQPAVRGDTLVLNHTAPFPADSWITVEVVGVGVDGRSFHFVLDGTRRFKTRKAIAAVESNTWSNSSAFRPAYAPGDTLWVRFSEPLHADLARIAWAATSAGKALYPRGTAANAAAWVKSDTLFVKPDQRLALAAGDRVGFNITVMAASGSVSSPIEILSEVDLRTFAVAWTNTRDLSGANRIDLGTLDSVVVVSSRRIDSLLGVAYVSGTSLPAGLLPADVVRRGDTLVYRPAMPMQPGIQYGLAFDVRGADGLVRRSALEVRWQTAYRVRIQSFDNRTASGYRRFRSLGDSLTVEFSEAVDTMAPFVVHMNDVNGNAVQVQTAWKGSRTRATLRIQSPLPLSDFGAPAVAASEGDAAKAVADASFDLRTVRGEVVYGLKALSEPVRIFTEEGLCPVATNLVRSHGAGYEVMSTEVPVDSFPVAGPLRVTFNRALDTAAIARGGIATFAVLETATGTNVPVDGSFADGGRTLVLTPRDTLTAGIDYLLRLKKVPGVGISGSAAVKRHGGIYSGAASGSFFLKSAFTAR